MITKRTLISSTILTLSLGLLACERGSNDIAASAAPSQGVPAYTVDAKTYGVQQVAFVKEVLPQGDEAPDGKALYAKTCGACHQLTGQGIPGAFPPLDGSVYVTGDKLDRLASIILYGLIGPIKVNGMTYNSAMTPMRNVLNDAELAAVATYIRGAWSNKAAPVTADIFAAMRQKWGERASFTIQELGEEQ